jgi:D-glycero-alpha-D-manno-heptose 1-phosphate guanylyltransferase
MEALILAGGLGTRLSSRLTGLPKSMAPVAGRRFLEIVLDKLIDEGCGRVILSVGYLRNIIIDAFRESYRGIPLEYVVEENPLGTGGAIRLALQRAEEPAVLVLNGDTYLDVELSTMLSHHRSAGRSMTMGVTRVEDMARYGGVVIDNQEISRFIEKGHRGPGWINAGTYVLCRNFPWPKGLPSRFSFEFDVLAPFLHLIRPAAFLCEGYFLDIGIPEDLDRAQIEFAGRIRQMPF